MNIYPDWKLTAPHLVVVIIGLAIMIGLLTMTGRKIKQDAGFAFDKCTFIDPKNPEKNFYIEHFCSLSGCPRCSNAEKQDPNAINLLLKMARRK